MFKPCDVVECLGHFDGIIPSLECILTKKHGVRSGKYLLNTPENAISETLNFNMSPHASALKNLCLWCEFQSHLLFITSLLLKNFLLFDSPVWSGNSGLTAWIHYTYPVRQRNFIFILWNKSAFVTTVRATSNAEMKLSVPHTSCYNKNC